MGVKSKTIHSLSQALGTGVVFLELQLKEYTAAFFTFRDSIFGSDFYGTTCLHGLHVTTGSTSFGILWCSLNNNEGYKEVHQYQKFWGYYWHLVDSIWISLFMLFYLRIIFKAISSIILVLNVELSVILFGTLVDIRTDVDPRNILPNMYTRWNYTCSIWFSRIRIRVSGRVQHGVSDSILFIIFHGGVF